MKHLTPYGASRFREADRQEMTSLMSADRSCEMPAPKVRAVMRALSEKARSLGLLPYINLYEYKIVSRLGGGPPDLSVSMFLREEVTEYRNDILDCRVQKMTKGVWSIDTRNSRVVSNNILITIYDRAGGPYTRIDVLPSCDDFFYVKVLYFYDSDHDEQSDERWPSSTASSCFFVCDGMRGLLDLIRSPGLHLTERPKG